jgi:hypothetical protein
MKDAKSIKVKLCYAKKKSIPSSRAETGKAHHGGSCRGKLVNSRVGLCDNVQLEHAGRAYTLLSTVGTI